MEGYRDEVGDILLAHHASHLHPLEIFLIQAEVFTSQTDSNDMLFTSAAHPSASIEDRAR